MGTTKKRLSKFKKWLRHNVSKLMYRMFGNKKAKYVSAQHLTNEEYNEVEGRLEVSMDDAIEHSISPMFKKQQKAREAMIAIANNNKEAIVWDTGTRFPFVFDKESVDLVNSLESQSRKADIEKGTQKSAPTFLNHTTQTVTEVFEQLRKEQKENRDFIEAKYKERYDLFLEDDKPGDEE